MKQTNGLYFKFTREAWQKNLKRLTNQVFKVLPMYENGEDWQAQVFSLETELQGYNRLLQDSTNFLRVVGRLESLFFAKDKMQFRKIVFEVISLLNEV